MTDELVEALRRIASSCVQRRNDGDLIARVAHRIAIDSAIPRKKNYFLRKVKENRSKRDASKENVGVDRKKAAAGLTNPNPLLHNAHSRQADLGVVEWKVPKNPKEAAKLLASKDIRSIINKNCSLIKTVDKDMIPGIERRVKRIYEGTSTPETLTRYLEDECDLAPHQAALIVRDQMQKYEALCHAESLKQQGVKWVRWVHGGSHEPRPWHLNHAPNGLNGLVFDINNPPIIDPETGERGLPGQLIGCKCHLEAVKRRDIKKLKLGLDMP